jgi:hypothetical protein
VREDILRRPTTPRLQQQPPPPRGDQKHATYSAALGPLAAHAQPPAMRRAGDAGPRPEAVAAGRAARHGGDVLVCLALPAWDLCGCETLVRDGCAGVRTANTPPNVCQAIFGASVLAVGPTNEAPPDPERSTTHTQTPGRPGLDRAGDALVFWWSPKMTSTSTPPTSFWSPPPSSATPPSLERRRLSERRRSVRRISQNNRLRSKHP